jgi:hypothetical protein
MKLLTLIRDETGDEGTFSVGTLTDGDNRLGFWDFVELPWRDNRAQVSCIPPGLYNAHLTHSDRFKREVYVLENVPERSFIEIHPANWAGDKALGYHAELNGCLAPGLERGLLTPPHHNLMQRAVIQSERAFQQLMDALDGDDIEVHILWAKGLMP